MKSRKILITVFFLFSLSYVIGIDVQVQNSCDIEYEPMLSLSDSAGGHIGNEDYYNTKVCVSDVEYFEIKNQCGGNERSVLSVNSRENAHISMFDNEYNYELCTRRLETDVRSSCNQNETKILSVTKDNNTHAASPFYTDNAYTESICLKREPPENVTVSISGLSGDFYADGANINTGESISPPAAYPYIVSNQPVGIVSYGGFQQLSRVSSDTVAVTQEPGAGSYLIPFSRGGYEEIEDEQTEINDRTFLNSVSPNFGFSSVEIPTVKVAYNPDQPIRGFEDTLRTGRIELAITKLGDNPQNQTAEIRPN